MGNHSVSNTRVPTARAYRMKNARGQYWSVTIPHYGFTPYLPPDVSWIRGQLERGDSGYLHWQLAVYFGRRVYLKHVTDILGKWHVELARSDAIEKYVWKEDTAIPSTRFELGEKPFKRQSKRDWDQVYALAVEGNISTIDKSILVPYYNAIKRICQDNLQPIAVERSVHVFWGDTATGKSRRAWEEAGLLAYPKDPRTKFWDGYNGQENVVIDEFRGAIAVDHLLRWLDRYPVIVEVKGSSTVFRATSIWITSNLSPKHWYADLDEKTTEALMRRLNVTHFNKEFGH